jgi:ribosomal-protein-alanine N-acetyltransferase
MFRRDVPPVAAIEAAVFGREAWPAEVFQALLSAFAQARPTRGSLWVAEEPVSRAVIGYAGVEVSGLRGEMDLINVAVAGEHRRRGVGRALLRRAVAHSRRLGVPLLWLRVRASNRAAQRFYRTLGFKPRGRFAGYYEEPDEPAVIMAMDVGGPVYGRHVTP